MIEQVFFCFVFVKMLNLSLRDNFKGDSNASAHTVPVITVFSDSDPLSIFDKKEKNISSI